MLAIWVKVKVKPDQKKRFLEAIEADALGFRMRLTPSDVTALRRLVAAVTDGATVSDH